MRQCYSSYFTILTSQVPVPIVFRGPNGASAGVAAQHSQDFSAWYSHCPGLKVGVAHHMTLAIAVPSSFHTTGGVSLFV